jgi:hypothetical protein
VPASFRFCYDIIETHAIISSNEEITFWLIKGLLWEQMIHLKLELPFVVFYLIIFIPTEELVL